MSHCPHKRQGKPHLLLADGDLTPWKRRDCHETYTTRKVSPAGTTSFNFQLAFVPMAVAISLQITNRRARNSGTWHQLLASPSLQSASRTQSLRLPSASLRASSEASLMKTRSSPPPSTVQCPVDIGCGGDGGGHAGRNEKSFISWTSLGGKICGFVATCRCGRDRGSITHVGSLSRISCDLLPNFYAYRVIRKCA